MRTTALLAFVALGATCGSSTEGQPPGSPVTGGASGAAGKTSLGGASGGSKSGQGGRTSTSGTGGLAGTGGGGGLGEGGDSAVGGTLGSGGSMTGAGGGVPGPQCKDGVWNQDETDVDCGGLACPTRCAAGKQCVNDSDCAPTMPPMTCPDTTFKCTDPCMDYLQDGDETGVDCGGSCPLKCVGGPCASNADCQTQNCDTTAGTCKEPAHPLILIKQKCWDGIKGFNLPDKAIAKSKIVPCLLTNDCCKEFVSVCTDTCFKSVDAVCGLNKFSGGAAPHDFIIAYYKNCVP